MEGRDIFIGTLFFLPDSYFFFFHHAQNRRSGCYLQKTQWFYHWKNGVKGFTRRQGLEYLWALIVLIRPFGLLASSVLYSYIFLVKKKKTSHSLQSKRKEATVYVSSRKTESSKRRHSWTWISKYAYTERTYCMLQCKLPDYVIAYDYFLNEKKRKKKTLELQVCWLNGKSYQLIFISWLFCENH